MDCDAFALEKNPVNSVEEKHKGKFVEGSIQ